MRNSFGITTASLFRFVRYGALASVAGGIMTFMAVQANADTFDEIASQDSVIASGLPDLNMDVRKHSDLGVSILANMLLHTWNGGSPGDDYASEAAAAASQEYLIYKFDFSALPSEATITGVGDFSFAYWYTHSTDASGTPHPNVSQETLGEFEFFEITAGDANWEDNQFSDGDVSPGAVTYNSLNGTFDELNTVTEFDTGEGGPLVAGKLISNGSSFGQRQRLTGIPVATLERLRSGASVGLAIGSIADVGLTNFSIHSSETFLADQNKDPRLSFEFTTDVVLDVADFDEDSDVDATDLATWQGAYGSTAAGDTNADTDSDGSDFLAWQQGYTGAALFSAVPEPTTLCLFGFGLLTLGLGRRRDA